MITSEIIPFAVPFAKPITLGGREFEVRGGCLLRLSLGGLTGWGECAPLPGFSDENYLAALADLKNALANLARGSNPEPKTPSAACALDAAFQGLAQAGAADPGCVARWGYTRSPHRRAQSVNAVLLEAEPPERARRLAEAGYRAIKLKVGGDPRLAAERVREVGATGAVLRLDANRGWTLAQAREFFGALGPARIEYIEEPAESMDESRQLASEGVPVALDESLKGLSVTDIQSLDWPTALVLKPMILGGLRRSRLIADAALRAGIRPVISSAIETDVGLRALALFAASIGAKDVPAGLGTSRLLSSSTTDPAFGDGPLVTVGGPFGVV